jgi:ribosomal protein S18 acetylase RimI-like enzyme
MTAGGPVRIRPAAPEDAGALARAHLQAWAEAYQLVLSAQFLASMELGPRLAMWQRVLVDPESVTEVADPGGGGLAGFASTRPAGPDDPRELELWGIYLLADWHGQGIGQRLLDAVIGDRPCFLWVAEDNPRAEAFYRRNRFLPDGARQNTAWMENLPVIRMVR